MRKILRGILIALACCTADAASARTVSELLSDQGDRENLIAILQDTGTGISTANSFLKTLSKEQLYCPPSKLFLTGEQYLDILRRHLDDKKEMKKAPSSAISSFLMLALVDAFPCK